MILLVVASAHLQPGSACLCFKLREALSLTWLPLPQHFESAAPLRQPGPGTSQTGVGTVMGIH